MTLDQTVRRTGSLKSNRPARGSTIQQAMTSPQSRPASPEPQRRAWRLLATYLGPQWRRAALLGVLLLGGIGLELAGPRIQRQFIDEATAGAELSALLTIALLFVGLAVASQLVS